MIDHVSIQVRDLASSSSFYTYALEPLGYQCLVERAGSVGFGTRYPEFWLNARPDLPTAPADVGAHVCLRARGAEAVSEFHRRALERGATDDGAPGPREASMVTYFAAFIRDPDGNRIEAMTVPAA